MIRRAVTLLLVVVLPASPVYALRANMLKDMDRLEKMGHYEEVLFYRRSSMDMVLALHCPLGGLAFDPAMDQVYPQLDRIYGTGRKTRHQQSETRVDRRYWGIVNGQRDAIFELLPKAKLTDAQRRLLDLRVRVYVEDHLSPELDEMGNFFFRRKAMIFEQTGLFHDAAFRRRLTGHYDLRVCVPYYATMAQELAARGETRLAAAYRAKSEWYREQALRELRHANGDRLLSKLKAGDPRRRMTEKEVLALIERALRSDEPDAQFAAAIILSDLHGDDLLGKMHVPAGYATGVRAEYFSRPGQKTPVAAKTLRAVDIGFRANSRFPEVLRPYWRKDAIFPATARGQFQLRVRGALRVPKAGRYRFYLRTEGNNRAVLRIGDKTVVSPANAPKRLYTTQNNWTGGALFRIDFSEPVELAEGLTSLAIDYQGNQVKTKLEHVGLRLYWSSEDRVMELVPSSALFHGR
ncbi:hypothetical protein HQ560_05865 [bacterium]|nr:hypothetical protein [bacterium]